MLTDPTKIVFKHMLNEIDQEIESTDHKMRQLLAKRYAIAEALKIQTVEEQPQTNLTPLPNS